MTEASRRCIASGEEIWVHACYQFFEEYGFWSWYEVPKELAFMVIMKNTRGQGNPTWIKQKIDDLYKDAGVRWDEE